MNSINQVTKLQHDMTTNVLGICWGFKNVSLLPSVSEAQTHCGQTQQTGQSHDHDMAEGTVSFVAAFNPVYLFVQVLWIRKLRSGLYEEGKSRLRSCCRPFKQWLSYANTNEFGFVRY